jgi:hypothetical protein
VLGYLVRGPFGGMAWHHLQYVVGLAQLGHDVYFLEDSDDYPCCYDPNRQELGVDPSYGLRFAAQAFDRLGFADRWGYYDAHTARWLGPLVDRARALISTADVLVNVSGVNPLRPWLLEVPARLLIDTDPAFTQVRNLTAPSDYAEALRHTALFSFGENIGRASSSVPDDGLPWRPTRQPVVLDCWPVTVGPADGAFTTVMQWNSYPALEYQGRRFGMKSASFWPYKNLPTLTAQTLELAVGGEWVPRDVLRENCWQVRDPSELSRDPWTYQAYIQASKAEFAVANQGYVDTHCGWFSERSAAYLASGRPVVVQQTGFSDWLHAAGGVLAFHCPDEAVAQVEDVLGRYSFHCSEARAVAEAYFEASKVLSRLLDAALNLTP